MSNTTSEQRFVIRCDNCDFTDEKGSMRDAHDAAEAHIMEDFPGHGLKNMSHELHVLEVTAIKWSRW